MVGNGHPQTFPSRILPKQILDRHCGLLHKMDRSGGTLQNHNTQHYGLTYVLWAYKMMPHSTNGETPFRLTYGSEAVIPVEIREPSQHTKSPLEEELNNE